MKSKHKRAAAYVRDNFTSNDPTRLEVTLAFVHLFEGKRFDRERFMAACQPKVTIKSRKL